MSRAHADNAVTENAVRVCVVCTGNICRSPMADVVLNSLVRDAGLADRVRVDSAGTHDYHVGGPADERAVRVMATAGYDGSQHRARQFRPDWFDRYDLVLAADEGHVQILQSHARSPEDRAKVRLLREFDPDAVAAGDLDVADPYYGPFTGFEECLRDVEAACKGVVAHLASRVTPPVS